MSSRYGAPPLEERTEEKVTTPAGHPQRYRCTTPGWQCFACDRLGYHIKSYADVPDQLGLDVAEPGPDSE